MISKKIPVNERNDDGFSPVALAAINNSAKVFRAIVDSGRANLEDKFYNNARLIHFIAENGNTDLANYLFEKTGYKYLDAQTSSGETPAIFAANKGKVEMIRYLAEKGADFNIGNCNGYTPLHFAAQNNDDEMVEALVRAGAVIDAITKKIGLTTLHIIAERNNARILNLLISLSNELELGLDLSVKSEFLETPAHFAAENGHVEILKILAARGVSLDDKNKNLVTPISMAVYNGHVEAVRFLAANKVDLNSLDIQGKTPSFHAALQYSAFKDEKFLDILAVLVSQGVSLSKEDEKEGGLRALLNDKDFEKVMNKAEEMKKNLPAVVSNPSAKRLTSQELSR